MTAITKSVTREIVDDFAKEIRNRRMLTAKPSKTVINFRNERKLGFEREIWLVPIDILRYRKENGRIASDVFDYEKGTGILDEKDEQAQIIIAKFLADKDPERTEELRKSILHSGQLEPAIITCDGFLINGNRRKMVMDNLHRKFRGNDDDFSYMKVVILPDKDEVGGPPTLLEIEKIENRYQLQSEGKSEYYGFDRAISVTRKIDLGLTLEEQLRDDPSFADATKAQLEKAVEDFRKKYLEPLECVNRYLKQFKREGQYRTISARSSDPEGRWQAFTDYANTYSRSFKNAKRRIEHGIEEEEIGSIEEAAFDIIRLRTIPDMPKAHVIMRDLAKYCGTKEGKREVIKIAEEVDPVISTNECFDKQGNPLPIDEIDAKWAAKNQQNIIYHIKKAKTLYETKEEKETPIGLLESAYKKLTHPDMDLTKITVGDHYKARQLISKIKERADYFESELYKFEKEQKKLQAKWKQ